ncbi:MAG: beta-hexosaminidase [Rickettsiales bacterium]|nr:MAG: beta-hexosaminidase [Rickettsiales bacterium]
MITIKPIIFGVAGTSLLPEEAQLFRDYPPAGFILFSRNIESKAQLTSLTRSLKNLYTERDIPIFIDQEGGRVARIKPPIASKLYPTGKYFADLYDVDKSQAKDAICANYAAIMSELKELGIDSPCAPVCDILYAGASDVIGDRCLGANADKVVDLCKSAISGIDKSSGIPFIKHIPGHGRATVDSHHDLPVVTTPLAELESTDFKVFKELSGEGVWGMTAHIIYTALDDSAPATCSRIMIDYIRSEIGFNGVLVSDDIGMYALHGEVGQKHSAIKKILKELENIAETKNIEDIEDLEKIKVYNKKLEEINPEFLESLAKVTRMSLSAGCDLILHCSGDIQEMRAVCEAL